MCSLCQVKSKRIAMNEYIQVLELITTVFYKLPNPFNNSEITDIGSESNVGLNKMSCFSITA